MKVRQPCLLYDSLATSELRVQLDSDRFIAIYINLAHFSNTFLLWLKFSYLKQYLLWVCKIMAALCIGYFVTYIFLSVFLCLHILADTGDCLVYYINCSTFVWLCIFVCTTIVICDCIFLIANLKLLTLRFCEDKCC